MCFIWLVIVRRIIASLADGANGFGGGGLDAEEELAGPDELGGEDAKADGDDDECGAGGNQHDDADEDNGKAYDGDDELACLAEGEVEEVYHADWLAELGVKEW